MAVAPEYLPDAFLAFPNPWTLWLQHRIKNTIVAGVTHTCVPVPKTPASWGLDLSKHEGSRHH